MKNIFCTALLLALVGAPPVFAQPIRGGGNPYSSQLVTDPDAGNVQGIQRYGRALATNPSQGTTYPYYVFPTVVDPGAANPLSGQPIRALGPLESAILLQKQTDLNNQLNNLKSNAPPAAKINSALSNINGASQAQLQTEKLTQSYSLLAQPVFAPGLDAQGALTKVFAQDQPLIQIKLRVVEILRDNSLGAASSLDFIRSKTGDPSFISNVGNVNSSNKNLTASSRFGVNGLIGVAANSTTLAGLDTAGGAGALVNLTGEHLNFIASILATELQADLVTAPVIVTTNGEAAEFVAGTRQPFNLGTVNSNAPANEKEKVEAGRIQNSFFYKHVGTYLHVTPRIVNYGGNGERAGDAALTMNEIPDWNCLIGFLLRENFVVDQSSLPTEAKWQTYNRPGRLVPLEIRMAILDRLNQFSKSELMAYFEQHAINSERGNLPCNQSQNQACGPDGCQWIPEDCNIDIEIVARFSNAIPSTGQFTFESDVRSIKNILQVKNGHGLVMAGLLSESDVEALSKVPVAGDLPLVGWLFRAKSVSRKKSEILIFLEAEVLPADPSAVRTASMSDFDLARAYAAGSTLSNPLEIGLHRSGIGNYLPPLGHEEQTYWNRCGARINRIRTTSYDMFR